MATLRTDQHGVVHITLCTWCQPETEPAEDSIEYLEHAMSMISDLATIEALKIIHGKEWLDRYLRVGGVLHMTTETFKKLAGETPVRIHEEEE